MKTGHKWKRRFNLKRMVFFKNEALLDKKCVEKHHDLFLRSCDKGGIKLVNPKHFGFGLKVIKLVSEAVIVVKLEISHSVTKSDKEKLLQ